MNEPLKKPWSVEFFHLIFFTVKNKQKPQLPRCSDEEYIWVTEYCFGWFRRGQSSGACLSDGGPDVQRSGWAYDEAPKVDSDIEKEWDVYFILFLVGCWIGVLLNARWSRTNLLSALVGICPTCNCSDRMELVKFSRCYLPEIPDPQATEQLTEEMMTFCEDSITQVPYSFFFVASWTSWFISWFYHIQSILDSFHLDSSWDSSGFDRLAWIGLLVWSIFQ